MKTTQRNPKHAGFTLLEMMVSLAILTVAMGVLFSMSIGIGDTARVQEAQIINNDEARRAMIEVIPRLRQAQDSTLNKTSMPGDVLEFRMAEDVDGNGTAVNIGGYLEVGGVVTIQRDKDDVNKDGRTATQLVMLVDGVFDRVLANNLSPDDGPAPSADPSIIPENTAGFWVEVVSGGIRVTIRTQGTSRQGHVIRQEFTEFVDPRN